MSCNHNMFICSAYVFQFAQCHHLLLVNPSKACTAAELTIKLCSFRYTMERPRFSDHLEAIKFICKDFWSELFKKQIDNLKTNHRVMHRIPQPDFSLLVRKLKILGLLYMQGTFVLQDNRFRWLTRVSLDPSVESTDATDNDSAPLGDTVAQTTSMLLYFPCGLIRGALTNLGISCSVSADMSNLPACKLSHGFS